MLGTGGLGARQTRGFVCAAVLLVLVSTRNASATFSVIGANTHTREVGASGASCLEGTFDIREIYAAKPGLGALVTQSYFEARIRDQGARLLAEHVEPQTLLASLSRADFDPRADLRQIAIIDSSGRSAARTGGKSEAFAKDTQGQTPPFVYSVQGNYLTGPRVLTQATESMASAGCDLAERLMLALEAAAANGEGDRRCMTRGLPADSAFIRVESTTETTLDLHVAFSASSNPVRELRTAFDAWRRSHPCPQTASHPS